jgi:signal transduction histidine kinase
LDNFVYRVSHDIRAPLSSVLGLVSLIEQEQDPAQLQLYLKLVTKSINKLDSFVKDILDYSRNSRMQVDREEINFSELIHNIYEDLQYMENAQRLQIRPELEIKAPHFNDPGRLRIIFRNLFSNAIKYQSFQLEYPYLKVHIQTDAKMACIRVEDNGIGIESDQVNRVFDMFHRASEHSNGSGLGLYIVKETVEKLGGSIRVKSTLGVGTSFTIQLPN